MNASHQIHPSREQLTAFTAGKLNAVESDEIEQHLSECDSCCHLLTDLPDEDTLTGLLRDDTSVSPEQASSFAQTIVHAPKASTNAPHDQATLLPEGDTAGPPLDLPQELREHGRYRIVRLIGRGGMGDVYEAEHKVMNRPVALKVIKPNLVRNDAAVRRFRREVQAAARLRHPNIVTAFDAEQAGDLHYLVMEFVDGVDLDDVIKDRGPLMVDEACDYIRQTADGLQHAHELGMVHRDIKPHNLMVESPERRDKSRDRQELRDKSQEPNRRGESGSRLWTLDGRPSVKILDFGLANFASETAAEAIEDAEDQSLPGAEVLNHLTQAGTMMGTPDYIAPEQAQDAHKADIRSDIYSLGCTFYTLLTGKTPFSEGSVLEKIKAHTETDARPLSEFRDDVPEEVAAILNKMMAKDPAERYQTPRDVAEALRQASGQRKPAGSVDQVRAPHSQKLHRKLVALAAGVIAALIAFAVYYIQTDYGVVRIEVADDSLEVQLAGETITAKDGEKEISIRPGEQKLHVKRGDFEFYADSFELRRGEKISLKVELMPGKIVVSKDGKRIGAEPLRETIIARFSQTETGGTEILLNGEPVNDVSNLVERLNALVLKNPHLSIRVEGDLEKREEDVKLLYYFAQGPAAKNLQRTPQWEHLMALASPLVSNQRSKAMQAKRKNQLKQIGIAIYNYQDTHRSLPPAADFQRANLNPKDKFDAEGRPFLSWRVYILPTFENGQELFDQFHLNEPWDSEHNKKLLDQMPTVFKTTDDPTKTTFLAVVGDGTAYEGKAGLAYKDMTDGTTNTALIVDAGPERAVPWTKPEDLPFDKEDPIRAFGSSEFGNEFLAVMADGRVEAIPYDTAPEQLRNLFLRSDGNRLDLNKKRDTPLPAVSADLQQRFGARRSQFGNLSLALFLHEKTYGRFPIDPGSGRGSPFDAEGKPRLSWRVHLLPFMGQNNLFQRFAHDEPCPLANWLGRGAVGLVAQPTFGGRRG